MQKHHHKRICAWTTRHPPTKAQRRQLQNAGYRLHLMSLRELRKADDILEAIEAQIEQAPDLIVAAMPKTVMHFLAQKAPCPVLIAKMSYDSAGKAHWTGHWHRVIRTRLETKPYLL